MEVIACQRKMKGSIMTDPLRGFAFSDVSREVAWQRQEHKVKGSFHKWGIPKIVAL
jgi:hypothetical protein